MRERRIINTWNGAARSSYEAVEQEFEVQFSVETSIGQRIPGAVPEITKSHNLQRDFRMYVGQKRNIFLSI